MIFFFSRSSVDSFWCMCTVMQVSRLVRWVRVSSVLSVRMTMSLRMVSTFFMFLDMMVLSVLALWGSAGAAGQVRAGVSMS